MNDRTSSRAGLARLMLALGLSTLLWGCVSAPQPAGPGVERISGRLSVQVIKSADEAPQGAAAGFELQGTAQAGQLLLTTPLGTVAARASWQPGLAVLKRSDTETHYENLDALTRELLGETIPVVALFDWLRGRPWPAAASQPLEDGKPGFRQLGWTIDLGRYADGLIHAKRTIPTEVSLRARLDPAELP